MTSGVSYENKIASKHDKLAILSEETDYAQALKNVFIQNNNKEQMVIIQEDFIPKTTDFRSLLLKLKGKSPQGLFINPQSDGSLVNIVKQIRKMKWQIPLYAAYYPSSATYLDGLKEAGDGITYVDLPFMNFEESLSTSGLKLYNQFQEKYGKLNTMDYFFALAMDSFIALQSSLNSSPSVKDHLYQGKFSGTTGSFSFDKNGDMMGYKHVLKTIKDNKPVLIKGV